MELPRRSLVVAAAGALAAAYWLGWLSSTGENADGAATQAGEDDAAASEAEERKSAERAAAAVETPSKELARPLRVTQLFVYPVKSMRGHAVKEAVACKEGFVNDRRWMVVDDSGSFLSQRRCAKMALITPRVFQDHRGRTILELESELVNRSIQIPLDVSPGALRCSPVRVWDDSIDGVHDQGDNAAQWLSTALKMENLRLVYMSDASTRRITNKYAVGSDDKTWFSDGFPYLIISQASLNDLNRRIYMNELQLLRAGQIEQVSKPLAWNRFRPNIVVSGLAPYEEDTLDSLTIAGTGRMHIVKPCSRCKLTTVIQETGELPSSLQAEPLLSLATYRKRGDDVYFGQNAILEMLANHSASFTVKVGDLFTKQSSLTNKSLATFSA